MSSGYYCLAVLFVLLAEAQAQLISPCPDLFQYEPQNPNEPGRWHGTLTILSDYELSGVWLRLLFDKPPIQLENWFGEVDKKSDTDFLVKSPKHNVAVNTPYKVRFGIRYDAKETPPMFTGFRLNAKTVCPAKGATTPPTVNVGQSWTSEVRTTTPNPSVPSVPVNSDIVSSPQQSRPSSSNQEDDFFQGDFQHLSNQTKPVIDLDNLTCGTVISAPRPLITHGQATHEAEFPWHAALYHVKGIDLTYICGASLVTRYHLVTAAHCVTRRNSPKPLSPDRLHVYLGKFYLKGWSNPGIQDKPVEAIIPHPNYDAQSFSNDIAIMKLASPAKITDYVRLVCLWGDDLHIKAVIDKPGTVAGWGFDETGKVTEQLNKAQMPVVSHETCIQSHPEFYSRFASPTTFCAGFRNGTSVCNGDSGGGMVFPKALTRQSGTVWQLRGVVSLSVALQNEPKCDTSHYVIFTDIAKYLDWIKATLNY